MPAKLKFWLGEEYLARVKGVYETRQLEAARRVEAIAVQSMVSGGTPHQPSAPGTPPHRDTENLAASVTSGTRGGVGFVSAGGGDVDYAEAQEFGNAHLPARPFLRPALEQARDEILEIMRRRL